MAKIDDLIDQINDAPLRERLSAAVKELRSRKRFGLVFEEHIPESALCAATAGLRPGAEVVVRTEPENGTRYIVESLTGEEVTIVAGEEAWTIERDDLLVVKRFGDPVFPVLRPVVESVVRTPDRAFHTVVSGENFHALQLLLLAYEGCVDCIYIDPPYNTRADDWKYNNNFVDPKDSWHHSKWLSMMEKRLKLAKRLLSPTGVLVVMIDEHELHHLGMLLERLFREHRHHVVSIVINSRGSTGNRNFASIEEQALFVVPKLDYDRIQARENVIPNFVPSTSDALSEDELLLRRVARANPDLIDQMVEAGEAEDDDVDAWAMLLEEEEESDLDEEDLDEPDPEAIDNEDDPAAYWRGAVRTGQGTSFRTQRQHQFYPLYFDPAVPGEVVVGEPLIDRSSDGKLKKPSWKKVKGLTPIWPVDEEGAERVWCYKPERMRAEIEKGNIKIGRFNPRRNTYAVNVRRVRRTSQRFRERTIWWEKAYDSGSNGTNVLKKLLGSSGLFPFPKSIYAVRDVLATIVGSQPDALILDFFAGSGTTLHATSLLNAIDDGTRRCILVTNNEVDSEAAKVLHEEGYYRADPEFEAEGIARRVTFPRVKAALTGVRPDGKAIGGTYKWADKRPWALGFEENAAFLELRYEDPDQIEIGERFDELLPTLWLAAGAIGDPMTLKAEPNWFIDEQRPFAVLLDEDQFTHFRARIEDLPGLTHVWLVTDSDSAFGRMRAQLAESLQVGMLYRDYLRNFRVNVEV